AAPGTNGGTFGPNFDLGINKGGEAVFQDTVSGGTATSGIFLFFVGQPVQSLALQGQAAPSTGGAFSTFGAPAINDNGQVAARATVSGGTASEGLFLFFAGSPATRLAAQGDSPAGGTLCPFSGFVHTSLHQTGPVAPRSP